MDTDLNLAIALKKKAIMAKNFCGNDLSLPTDGLALLLHLDVRQSFVFFCFFLARHHLGDTWALFSRIPPINHNTSRRERARHGTSASRWN